MKRRTLLRLIVSALLIAAFVIGATIVEASNSLNPQAWYWAQRQLPLLWIVDAFALAALVPVCGVWGAQNRLHRKAEETTRSRDEHQAQLENMILHAERADQTNAEQADIIAALQNTLAQLSAKLETVEADGQARQQALEAEARRLAEQAFAAVNGQVEANTRQMEAVNLAMQYQRAEIKQLRQGMRVIQRHHDVFTVAQLTPDELAAIESVENLESMKYITDAGASDRARDEAQSDLKSIEGAGGEDDAEPLRLSSGAGEPGFFAPTMNGQATFVSSPTAFTVAAPLEDSVLEDNILEDNAAEDKTPNDGSRPEAASTNLHVSEEEYRWLTRPDAAPLSGSAAPDNAVSDASPLHSVMLDSAIVHTAMPHSVLPDGVAGENTPLAGTTKEDAPLAAAPPQAPASAPAARRWKFRL